MKTPEATALLRVPVFPVSRRVTGMLYYESNLSLSAPGSGVAGNYIFSANGVYDPNVTGTGHQPMAFDQMMLYYEQATVVRSSITVACIPAYPMRVAIYLSPDVGPITDPSRLVENGLIKSVPLSGLASAPVVNNRQPEITLSCDVASYFGRKTSRELTDDDQLTTTAAANPTEQVYFIIAGWQLTPDGSTAKALTFDVLLSYDVIFWEPRKLTVS